MAVLDQLKNALSDRYLIEEQLGEGGMATVYLAHDVKHDRKVALKLLRPDLGAVLGGDRFLSEIKISAGLDHPHILTLIDSGVAEGLLYYVLPYVRGGTLRDRLTKETQLGIDDAVSITKQVASALDYAHRQGVVHRDIKPENIMFQEGQAMLADFGIALAVKEAGGNRLTETGLSLGTPQYMSPEQATGDRALDARSDIYSLAAVLYEMLTGEPPVSGATAQAMIAKLMTERPTMIRTIRSTVPAALDDAVNKALAKIPADRHSGAAEFSAALDASMAPATTRAAFPWRGIGVAAAAVAVVVVGVAMLRSDTDSATPQPTSYPTSRQVSFTGDVRSFALAPDDRSVAYMPPGNQQVVLLDLDGGGSQTLYTAPVGTSLFSIEWATDGSRLYIGTVPYVAQLLSVPRLGGTPREELQLENLVGLNGADVQRLPDGRWLIAGSANTFYVGSDPGGLRPQGTKLVGDGTFSIPGIAGAINAEGRDDWITPSHDGRWLAFHGRDTTDEPVSGIASIPASGEAEVSAMWLGTQWIIGWTGDDRGLFLARGIDERTFDVLRVEFDPEAGRVVGTPLLVYPRVNARSIKVSSGGDRLIFSSGQPVMNLREITLDDTRETQDNPKRLLTTGTSRWVSGLSLPNGSTLGLSIGNDRFEFTELATDGSSRSVFQGTGAISRGAFAVSTDGRRLALAQMKGDTAVMIVRDMESGRTREMVLPTEPSSFAWSPDDRFIVAMTTTLADKMMITDVTAGTTRMLQLDCGEQCEFAYEGVRSGPDWPRVAVTSEVDTWIVDVETGALRHLAEKTWLIAGWVGDWVYFARTEGQTEWPGYVLFRAPASGGPEERLLDLPTECVIDWGFNLSLDATRVICPIDESKTDLHVIDGLGGTE